MRDKGSGVRSSRYKSFRRTMKLKTAPKFAGVHLIFDDQLSEMVINSSGLSVCS